MNFLKLNSESYQNPASSKHQTSTKQLFLFVAVAALCFGGLYNYSSSGKTHNFSSGKSHELSMSSIWNSDCYKCAEKLKADLKLQIGAAYSKCSDYERCSKRCAICLNDAFKIKNNDIKNSVIYCQDRKLQACYGDFSNY